MAGLNDNEIHKLTKDNLRTKIKEFVDKVKIYQVWMYDLTSKKGFWKAEEDSTKLDEALDEAVEGASSDSTHKTLLMHYFKAYQTTYLTRLKEMEKSITEFKVNNTPIVQTTIVTDSTGPILHNEPKEVRIKINSNVPKFKGTQDEDLDDWIFYIEASLGEKKV